MYSTSVGPKMGDSELLSITESRAVCCNSICSETIKNSTARSALLLTSYYEEYTTLKLETFQDGRRCCLDDYEIQTTYCVIRFIPVVCNVIKAEICVL